GDHDRQRQAWAMIEARPSQRARSASKGPPAPTIPTSPKRKQGSPRTHHPTSPKRKRGFPPCAEKRPAPRGRPQHSICLQNALDQGASAAPGGRSALHGVLAAADPLEGLRVADERLVHDGAEVPGAAGLVPRLLHGV